jgi:hypothetical protein
MSRAGNAETSSNTKQQSKVIEAVSFLYLPGPAGLVYQLKGSQPSCYRQPMEGKVKAYLMLWHQLTIS